MPLQPGQMLSQYRIAEKIGEGGMGEVYRAEDTKLGRSVAIKVLPDAFVQDSARLARFSREAQLLASLNHPNIAGIHGLEEADGITALALELVEGETLAERIGRGPIPLEEAAPIALQIAEALEAAHEKGIIHRDLKPGNVKFAADGRVKVLDFGLAKALDEDGSWPDMTQSPTLSVQATQAGVILGTAAYMSPEQAAGKAADRRADIWAFGVVLAEMLTGRRPFQGESASYVLAAVLKDEPEWESLPADIPVSITRLLQRCLQKDPKQRLQAIGDARIEIEETLATPPETRRTADAAPVPGFRPRTRLALAAILLLVGVAVGFAIDRVLTPSTSEQRLRRFFLPITAEEGQAPLAMPVISPDGRTIAYVFDGRLWLRDLDQVEPRPLIGTDSARRPFWSPDSAHLGYQVKDSLWRIPASGGQPVLISDDAQSLSEPSWGADQEIVFSRLSTIATVPARGGEPSLLFKRNWKAEDHFHGVQWLPGGRGLLVVVHRHGTVDAIDLWVDGERRNLVTLEDSYLGNARYSPTDHILFTRERNKNEGVWALPFSLSTLEVTGEPFLVVPKAGSPSASADGTLIYVDKPEGQGVELIWFDPAGRVLETIGQPQTDMWSPALSPDGTEVAVVAEENNERDLWIHDIAGRKRRLTFDDGTEFDPHWSPDGNRIFYHRYPETVGAATMYAVDADGSSRPQELTEGEQITLTGTGDSMVFVRWVDGTGADLWSMSLESGGEPEIFLQAEGDQWGPKLSPDGRYLAYSSEESGEPEIYIKSFPEGSGMWQVSEDGGWLAYWSPAGDRLYYHVGASLMEVEVSTDPELQLGTPRMLVDSGEGLAVWRRISMTQDGARFVGIRRLKSEEDEKGAEAGIYVVENWLLDFED